MAGFDPSIEGRCRWEHSGEAERTGPGRVRCSEGCLSVAGACSPAVAGCSRSRWTTARRRRPRWTRRCSRREVFGTAEYPAGAARPKPDDRDDVDVG